MAGKLTYQGAKELADAGQQQPGGHQLGPVVSHQNNIGPRTYDLGVQVVDLSVRLTNARHGHCTTIGKLLPIEL